MINREVRERASSLIASGNKSATQVNLPSKNGSGLALLPTEDQKVLSQEKEDTQMAQPSD